MSYFDFVVRKEHRFLKSILREPKLNKYVPLESLRSYYNAFTKFLKILILLKNSFGNLSEFEEINNEDLLEFCQNDCYEDDSFTKLINEIKKSDRKRIK